MRCLNELSALEPGDMNGRLRNDIILYLTDFDKLNGYAILIYCSV